MVLLQIDTQRVACRPLERYTPRPVHVQAVARRLESAQRMEIETRNIQLRQFGCSVHRVQAPHDAIMQIGAHLAGHAASKQFSQPLVPKTANHYMSTNS